MKYPVAVWFEEGTYTAEVPSLPGVVTEADNLPDLEKAIKEAASGWMEAELDSGRLIPSITSETLKNTKIVFGCSLILTLNH